MNGEKPNGVQAPGGARNGCGIAVRGCKIFDAPHMAMRYESNDCVFESNNIHHVLLETGDAGAIYSGRDWTTQGNVVCHNFIHDIGATTPCAAMCSSTAVWECPLTVVE